MPLDRIQKMISMCTIIHPKFNIAVLTSIYKQLHIQLVSWINKLYIFLIFMQKNKKHCDLLLINWQLDVIEVRTALLNLGW